MPRLGVLASHPIQYQAPLFRALAERMDVHVFFAHRQTAQQQADAGYGIRFEWDSELLSGFRHSFLANRARRPGVDHFFGCDTPEIGARIGDGNFDAFLVFGWNLRAYWQAVGGSRRNGVPVMVRGDSQLATPRSPLKRAVKSITHPWMLKQFDAWLPVGVRAREYLLHYGAPPSRIFPAPHCVDVDWFKLRASAACSVRSELRSGLGAGPGDLLLLFVGRLVPVKRPADVMLASRRLLDRGRRVVPVFAGAGPLEPELRRLAVQLGVPARFTGFRNQSSLPELYTAADLLILPSASETWGLTVNEAMACGCPAVVSSGVGCAPDLIESGRTGAVYPAGGIDALAEAIHASRELRVDPAAQDAMLEKMREYSPAAAASGIREATLALSRRTAPAHARGD